MSTRSERSVALLVMGCVLVGVPPASAQTAGTSPHGDSPPPIIFQTSDRCVGCHQGVADAAGRDVSIGFEWRASMMANSARDPYWQAGVRREVTDHPSASAAIQNECSRCHMPMANTMARQSGGQGRVFANLPVGVGDGTAAHPGLAADGTSCAVCHQITDARLGEPESFTGGFVVDPATPWGERAVFGPFEVDPGRRALMRSAAGYEPLKADHVQSSELCATCHTLYTHALDEDGNPAGELPEQVPYLEWLHSAYPEEGRSCQSCHMPVVEGEVPVTGVLGEARQNVSRHVFRGGNFFMLGMLNRHRDELGVVALPQELDAGVQRTREHLGSRSATVTVEDVVADGDLLTATVVVENLAGHKLPTAYPSRRAWLHVTVRDASGEVVFESGAVTRRGDIVGNDNDADPSSFEPHHRVVRSEDEVQIYEAILEDHRGNVTTGLIRAVDYAKDNRVTPRGFDLSTADPDIAVHGAASEDGDFVDGGDRVRYEVPLAGLTGPYTVEAELLYQPIGFRWARNLAAYDTPETNRFTRMYEGMAHASSALLARDRAGTR